MTATKNLRIQILTHTGAWGGSEVHTMKVAKFMANRDHAVCVIGLNHNLLRDPCLRSGAEIEYHCVKLSKPVSQMRYWGWKSVFRTYPADVCILVKNSFGEGSFVLDLAARHSFKCYLTIEQCIGEPIPPKTSRRYLGGLIPGLGLWWYSQKVRKFLRSLAPHRVVCVSHAVRHRLVRDYRFSANKTVTIHNGVDPEQFQPNRDFRVATRNAWGISQDAFIFGALGRLDNRTKGYDIAVELFAQLRQSLPSQDLRLVLAGMGPDEQPLKSLARRLGVDHLLTFPGFVNRPWEVYPAFDVFVMPSHIEGLPLALAEAMACGCCPVAMGVAGVPEVIPSPELGWLVPSEDRRGFLSAMETAARCSAEERRQVASRARQQVVDNFDDKNLLTALANLIEPVDLGRRGRL
jgi:glycosyltransferase involved in cell wall biosynthesis